MRRYADRCARKCLIVVPGVRPSWRAPTLPQGRDPPLAFRSNQHRAAPRHVGSNKSERVVRKGSLGWSRCDRRNTTSILQFPCVVQQRLRWGSLGCWSLGNGDPTTCRAGTQMTTTDAAQSAPPLPRDTDHSMRCGTLRTMTKRQPSPEPTSQQVPHGRGRHAQSQRANDHEITRARLRNCKKTVRKNVSIFALRRFPYCTINSPVETKS